MKVRFTLLILLALILSGCSIEIRQPAATPANVFPSTVTPPSISPSPAGPATQIPVIWDQLHLTGRLVYINGVIENNNYVLSVQMLDLVTGRNVVIFHAPVNTWIYYVAVSPDERQLLMSYSPPYQENPDIRQALYSMPLDGSSPPQLLFKPPMPEDQFNQAEWSPDGRYIYFTHVNYQLQIGPNQINPLYEIYRVAYPGGQPEKVADQAYWPRLSADSTRMTYIAVDAFAFQNRLMVADADGRNAQEVLVSGSWNPDIKDAPIFAPDGQSILLSAAAPIQSSRPNWWERSLGIKVAKADGTIPSEWWSVPIGGGTLLQLTHILSIGLFASISPDKQFIASASGNGIFVMRPDGSDLTVLLPDEVNSGTVCWIP